MLRSVLVTGASVLLAGSLVACGGDEEPATVDSPGSSDSASPGGSESAGRTPSTSATPHDPPKKFGTGTPMSMKTPEPGAAIPGDAAFKDRVAIVGQIAVMIEDGYFVATDVTTGERRWQLPAVPAEQAQTIEVANNSGLTTMKAGDRTLVVAAFSEQVKGSGTTLDHGQVSVQAIDPAEAKPAWKVDVDWSPYGAETTATPPGVHQVVADNDSGLVAVGLGSRATLVVDANTQKLVWGMKSHTLMAFGQGVVALQTSNAIGKFGVIGLDAKTKQERWALRTWSKETTSLNEIGSTPSVVVLSQKEYKTDPKTGNSVEPRTRIVLSLASGKPVARFKGNDKMADIVSQNCEYDGTSVLVCSYAANEIFAVDATTGQKLWGFDNTGSRRPPAVTAALHGVIYTKAQNGPALLDAKTGQDVPGDPGAVAMVVNEYGAASYETDIAPILLHPAIG